MRKIQEAPMVELLRLMLWKRAVRSLRQTFAYRSLSYSEKLTAKAQKITIKLPWEINTIYSEILKNSGHQSDDEEDEDDIEAHEASIQRLREADEATRKMTREEYQHYSDCRQASFTYRKGLRQKREFV